MSSNAQKKRAKQKTAKEPVITVVFRLPSSLHASLREAVDLLNIDTSSLLRMMIAEHIGEYIGRGRKGRTRLEEARIDVNPVAPVDLKPKERTIEL